MIGYIALIAYAATIPLANWMIGNVGLCHGVWPCVIPVGFGLYAPSGVLMVGAALVLRDAVHSKMGGGYALAAICFGVFASFILASPELAIASAVAFAVSEFADFAVYAPLRRKSLASAVLLSGAVGSVADSAVFLWMAFGSFDFIAGQVVGKLMISIIASVFVLGRGK